MDVKDIGKKIENENLVKAMKEVRANENSATLRTLFESVVHAVFVVPAKFDEEPKPDENGKVTFQNGVKINFSLLTNEQGDKVLPCFTDYESMDTSQFAEGFQRIILPYKQLEDLVYNSNGQISGIAMNPFSDNCFISGEFIRQYRENSQTGLVQSKLKPGAKIKLRTPKYQPVQMLDVAKDYLVKSENINRAYIQMMEEEGQEDKYLVALEVIGDEKKTFAELIPLMKPYSFGIELAFVRTDNPLGRKVADLAEPFYVKEGLADVEDTDGESDDVDEGTEE